MYFFLNYSRFNILNNRYIRMDNQTMVRLFARIKKIDTFEI